MNKLLLLLSVCCMGLASCYSYKDDPQTRMQSSQAAVTPDQPLQFKQMIYENDYNAVASDDDPAYYVNNILDSALIGMAYQLPNDRPFAPGVFAVVGAPEEELWYKVRVRALKKATDVRDPVSDRGYIVFSWARDNEQIHYYSYSIKDLLIEQNRQIVDKWETVEVWQKVPVDVQQGDILKAYVWNVGRGGTLYIDDFVVTAWMAETSPIDLNKSTTRVLVEQGYEQEASSNSFTTQYAHRGVYSNVVAKLPNYYNFGKDYTTTAAAEQLQGGDALRISFAALKQDKLFKNDEVAVIVCSVERGGKNIYWDAIGINSRLWKDGKQLLKEWQELEWWQVLPDDLQASDRVKIYVWNNFGTLIFIDDLKVEVVRAIE